MLEFYYYLTKQKFMTIKNQVQLNVLGEKIEICSCAPMTGWLRDGFCNYEKNDIGNHSI